MKNSAFTLVELLVVVLIIGILTAIAVPQYQKAVDKSRLSELTILTKHVKDMQEVYYLAKGSYAADCVELGVNVNGYTLDSNNFLIDTNKKYRIACNWGGARVSSQIKPDVNSGSNFLALEYYFDHSENVNAGKAQCWSNDDTRYKNMCAEYCGQDVSVVYNTLGNPNGNSCYRK